MTRIRRTKLEKRFDDALTALGSYNPNAPKNTGSDNRPRATARKGKTTARKGKERKDDE